MVRRPRPRTTTLAAAGAALALAVPLTATVTGPAAGAPPPERGATCDPFTTPELDPDVPTAEEVLARRPPG